MPMTKDAYSRLAGVAFTLDMRLPWEWWTAGALLELVLRGEGRWRGATLDGACIEVARHMHPRPIPACIR